MTHRLAVIIRDRYEDLLAVWHNHRNPPVVYPSFRLDDDLTDMTAEELDREMRAVEYRLDMGITEPEGEAGLNYRLHRLKAQMTSLARKKPS